VFLPRLPCCFVWLIADALASGTPVVTTTGTPWKVIEERGFGHWVEPTADSIARALDEMLSLPSRTREEMGRQARKFALREYSWYRIGREMYSVLKEVAGK
jgi:glycosyltransferase involved in cell wall biosynthesis